jgi:hypothetical protein
MPRDANGNRSVDREIALVRKNRDLTLGIKYSGILAILTPE